MKKNIKVILLTLVFLTITPSACVPASTSVSPTLTPVPPVNSPVLTATAVTSTVIDGGDTPDESAIPEDVNDGVAERLDFLYAPQGFTTVLGWLQASTLSKTQQGEPVLVIIDYMRLIEKKDDGSEHIVYSEDYDVDQPYLQNGGLFIRSPRWFATDDSTPIYNSEIKDGFLILDVSATPDNILHWWTDRVYCDPHARYF